MNKVVLPFLIIISSLYAGCSPYCSGTKLFVDVSYGVPGDTLSIYADSVLIGTKSFTENVLTTLRKKKNRITEICVTKDSLLIEIFYSSKDLSKHIPSKDTSFYIHAKEIRGFSISTDVAHEINVYLDKVEGGYGIYEPDSR
jgi:hypothetical protein